MAEYIDRQAVLDELDEDIAEFVECDYALKTAKKYIKKIPPADVRPVVRGRWGKDSDGLYICSECEEVALQRVFIKLPKKIVDLQMVQSVFCPNCGADMRGGDPE